MPVGSIVVSQRDVMRLTEAHYEPLHAYSLLLTSKTLFLIAAVSKMEELSSGSFHQAWPP